MQNRIYLFILAMFLIVGCASEPPEPATPITWDQISGDFVQRRVSLEGFVTVPRSVMATDTMLLPLWQELENEEAQKISFSTKIGSSKNQVEAFPKKYQESDFKLHGNDGELIPAGSKIRISGKLIGDEKAWVVMGPLVIEKL